MTFLTTTGVSVALAVATPQIQNCSLSVGRPSQQRVFTNADLERMAACRDQAPTQPEAVSKPDENPRAARRLGRATLQGAASDDNRENDWRAQWRSIDQKARRLRREAHELRLEATESPRDPKRRVVGRRSPSLLIARAEALEDEARRLTEEFDERARREGALPGWLRPKAR